MELPRGGAKGMVVTQGGRFGGYGFYLLKGKPVLLWNLVDPGGIRCEGPEPLSPGKHLLEFDFKYDGLGIGALVFNDIGDIGRRGTGALKVDGKKVARKTKERTPPLTLQRDENFEVGADTGKPVNDKDYQVPFRFTGKIESVRKQRRRPGIVRSFRLQFNQKAVRRRRTRAE